MALLATLRRLFGGSPTTSSEAPERAAVMSRSAHPDAAGEAPAGGLHPFQEDPDQRFTAWVLGVRDLRPGDAGASERRIIESIERLARGSLDPSVVPRLPVVLPRLIGLVRRDDVSPRELAERLSHDPALVGDVVRLANSPRYRASRDVASLQEAVIALGQRGLAQLVTNAVMRPIFDNRQGRFSRSAGTTLWALTERCAIACDALCADHPDRFRAYLAGMMANIGFLAALRVLDSEYQDAQPPDSEGFHVALNETVAGLSGQIARQWEFHPDVCRAVAARATRGPEAAQDDLTRALRAADRISKWHLLAPGLTGAALAALEASERRCYVELERAFA